MEWMDRLLPPYLETVLDRLSLTTADRMDLRSRWLLALRSETDMIRLAQLFDRCFNHKDFPPDLSPVDAALLCLLQAPVAEATARHFGLEEQILNDTLSDVGRWMAKERRVSGRFGMTELPWVSNALGLNLVQLGSLHFMQSTAALPFHVFLGQDGPVILAEEGQSYREDGWGAQAEGLPPAETFTTRYTHKAQSVTGHPLDRWGRCARLPVTLPLRHFRRVYRPGDPVTEVHIPEGTDLSPDAVRASFRQAISHRGFPFREPAGVFTCHSWMLSPMLEQLVPASRLAAFSALWHRAALPHASGGQFFERAFDFRFQSRETAPRDTALRRAILDTQEPLLDSAGFLLAEEFEEE